MKAAALSIEKLLGHVNIPAGLFNHPEIENLSAILFSNAGTLPKFQRMAIQAEFSSPIVKARRVGILFDRTEEALEPIDFDLDIQSPEYINLCDVLNLKYFITLMLLIQCPMISCRGQHIGLNTMERSSVRPNGKTRYLHQ